jgi:hypothetical protein
MVEDEAALRHEEEIFRSGKPSGSREIIRAIEEMAPGYQKIFSDSVPGTGRAIEVYAKQ